MAPALRQPDPATAAGAALIVALIVWQAAAAALVTLDTYDGYDTIVNARYFLGRSESYVLNRMPLMAWLVAPAEWVREALGLGPLDVRPVHAVTGVLHALCLVAVYRMLSACLGGGWSTVLAFASAVPTFVHFSYAPLISHDIAPGTALLAVVLLADRYYEDGALRPLAGAVAIGVVAALVKVSFGLIWVGVLLAYGIAAAHDATRRRRWLGLAAGAVTAGSVTWLALAGVLRNTYPELPLLAKPWGQIAFITSAGNKDAFVWWVYLRNFPAYGWLTALLIVPALVMAIHPGVQLPRKRLFRAAAVVWIFCFLFMQSQALREVRYLAFLAPLSALLLWAPWRVALRHRFVATSLLAVGAFSLLPFFPYSPVGEAIRIASPHLRAHRVEEFLAPLGHGESRRAPLIISGTTVFAPPRPSPLVGDPFHGIVHFGVHHVRILLGYGSWEVKTLPVADIARLETWPAGAALVISPDPGLTNPLAGAPAPDMERAPPQVLAIDDRVTLTREAGGYAAPHGESMTETVEAGVVVLRAPRLASRLSDVNLLRLDAGEDTPREVELDGSGRLLVHGPPLTAAGETLTLRGFRALRVESPYWSPPAPAPATSR